MCRVLIGAYQGPDHQQQHHYLLCIASSLLQGLLKTPQALYAMVLSPTRELAIQIAEQFEALGSGVGVKCAVLVGGIDMMAQAIALGRRPHVIVGTPGRVVDHLSNTKVCCCCEAVPAIYKAFACQCKSAI